MDYILLPPLTPTCINVNWRTCTTTRKHDKIEKAAMRTLTVNVHPKRRQVEGRGNVPCGIKPVQQPPPGLTERESSYLVTAPHCNDIVGVVGLRVSKRAEAVIAAWDWCGGGVEARRKGGTGGTNAAGYQSRRYSPGLGRMEWSQVAVGRKQASVVRDIVKYAEPRDERRGTRQEPKRQMTTLEDAQNCPSDRNSCRTLPPDTGMLSKDVSPRYRTIFTSINGKTRASHAYVYSSHASSNHKPLSAPRHRAHKLPLFPTSAFPNPATTFVFARPSAHIDRNMPPPTLLNQVRHGDGDGHGGVLASGRPWAVDALCEVLWRHGDGRSEDGV
ncbi:hypothetical protein R3P38DRAFT_2791174 [Favolaschia claudopus]|uniref:Uncharacterized protein n=1 Tax=Favolaschia claudopus TaxID=2862362 RepID=A0AAW0AIY4_9AGAR